MKAISVTKQSVSKVVSGLLVIVLLVSLSGCAPAVAEIVGDEKAQEKPDINIAEIVNRVDDEDVIVAGTVDTSSEFSFEVRGAFIGFEDYSDDPLVILVGDFTNHSDKTISYSYALDAVAFQGGRALKSAYLWGVGSNTYEDVDPGATNSVLIAWKLTSVTDDVEITVVDSRHYAKEVLFEGSFTVDELIKNTLEFIDEFSDVVNEN